MGFIRTLFRPDFLSSGAPDALPTSPRRFWDDPAWRWWALWWAAGLALLFLRAMREPPPTAAAPQGFVNLELARDPARAATILAGWAGLGRVDDAVWAVALDFGVIVAYVTLLGNGAWWAWRALDGWHRGQFDAARRARAGPDAEEVGARLARLDRAERRRKAILFGAARLACAAALVAGVCDAVENVYLLQMLGAVGTEATAAAGLVGVLAGRVAGWSFPCSVLAGTKIGLLVAVTGWLLAAWRARQETGAWAGVAYRARYSLGLSALLLALTTLDQFPDALRFLVENAPTDPGAVAVFVGSVFLFGFCAWRWAVFTVGVTRRDGDDEAARAEADGAAGRWAPRVAGVLPPLIVAGALGAVLFASRLADGAAAVLGWWLWAVFAGVPVGFLLLCALVDARPGRLPGQIHTFLLLDKGLLALNALLTVGFFLTIALGGKAGWLWCRHLGGTAVFFAGMALALPFGSLLVVLSRRTGLPLLAALGWLVVGMTMFDVNDNHAVRRHAETLKVAFPPGGAEIAPLEERFLRWLTAQRARGNYGPDEPYPVVFFAGESGGIMAGYEAAMTMAALQDKYPHFRDHLFLISGVSGGSVGSAAFTGLLYETLDAPEATFAPIPGADGMPATRDPRTIPFRTVSGGVPALQRDGAERRVWAQAVDAIFRKDMLSPSLAGLLSPDLVQRFIPFVVTGDGGNPLLDRALGLEYALEAAFEEGTREAGWAAPPGKSANFLTLPLGALEGEADPTGALPVLYFNTCDHLGDRIVVNWLRPPRSAGVVYLGDLNSPGTLRGSRDYPISTAACLSARFPVFSPAGTLTAERRLPAARPKDVATVTTEKLRCIDGAGFENSGLNTLTAVVNALWDGDSPRMRAARPLWYPVVINTTYNETGRAYPPTEPDTGPGQRFDARNGGDNGEAAFPKLPAANGLADALLTPFVAFIQTAGGHARDSEWRLTRAIARWQSESGADSPARRGIRWVPMVFVPHQDRSGDATRLLPLGWLMSLQARAEMVRQVDTRLDDPDADLTTALSR